MTPTKSNHRSLFGEILDWMLTPLLLLWPVSLALTWVVAQSIAERPFDRALETSVKTVAQMVVVQVTSPPVQATTSVQVPLSTLELLESKDDAPVFHQVLGIGGELVAGEGDLPLPPEDEAVVLGEVGLRDETLRGMDLRVAHMWIALGPQGARPVLVQVAESQAKRAQLATEIVKGVMLPQFASMPLAVLLVWLGLRRGMRPLNRLAGRIRDRSPDDLRAIDDTEVLEEVSPLVDSVNGLLKRLKGSLNTQKRFLADAAHQLKTPLAGLRMQAELALREGASEEELKQSLRQVARSSIRATHTVNQLLALARAENTGQHSIRQPVHLARIVADVVQDALARALDRRIDLGYEGPSPASSEGQGANFQGNALLIKELVRNLVDNALAYTTSGGVVTVRLVLATAPQPILLQVEDSGPGVAQSERLLVFDPFYRALGTDVDGSGLGLTIVREIAQQHGASVDVSDAQPGKQPPGALFSVRFSHV